MEKKVCGFTGYRPEKLPYGTDERHPDCICLKKELLQQVYRAVEDGMTYFICGGAQGADTFAAEAVLFAQKAHPEIVLEIAAPFLGQERTWAPRQQARYHAILDKAQRITYISDTPAVEYFFKRNRYIVDHADRIVAVFDGKRGGTAQTVRYAEKQGKQLVRLSPTGKVLEEDRQLRFPWEPV